MIRRHELKNEEWERIKDFLPPEHTGKRGRPAKSNRVMLNAMLWIDRTGAQWRALPEYYGPWQSVYSRFCKWRDDGVIENIFNALNADADTENPSIDSTCAKVHQSANGNKKGL
jgi:transposase